MLTCPFHYITGWLCPLCGGQRMLLALFRGHITEAFRLNPVAFILGILIAAIAALHCYNVWAQKRNRPTYATSFVRKCTGGTALLFLITTLLLWGVVRNL